MYILHSRCLIHKSNSHKTTRNYEDPWDMISYKNYKQTYTNVIVYINPHQENSVNKATVDFKC